MNVALWGLASGIMVSASLLGLVREGLANGTYVSVGVGVLLVVVAHEVIEGAEVSPRKYEDADYKKLLLILGVLTVHSFPEGVAVGVAFADLGIESGVDVLGVAVPLLGVPNWRLVWWAVFSSLPQPLGAVVAFYFVRVARDVLPYGFGFAAGAMVFLVVSEFIPEALETGSDLPNEGRWELVMGLVLGALVMVPLLLVDV